MWLKCSTSRMEKVNNKKPGEIKFNSLFYFTKHMQNSNNYEGIIHELFCILCFRL